MTVVLRGAVRSRLLFRHPAQVIVVGFGSAVVVGTLLLALPVSRTGEGAAPLVTALFTSTSAVCVTGLVTVDTASYWSPFGEAVILGLIQIGGFGIMTLASLAGILLARRLGLTTRLRAAAETKAVGIEDLRSVLVGVFKTTVLFETATMAALTLRFWLGYDESVGRSLYLGLFHAISAFNNAGFALWPDSLTRFATDPWICLPIAISVIAGGLGFPVMLELRRHLHQPRRWSLHTKLTVTMTAVLLVIGCGFLTVAEWANPATLGQHDTGGRLLAGFFAGVMPRTAGFNSIDVGAMDDASLLVTIVLMFIGGGSAGTAGGIKVTTFVVLLVVIIAEVRGERSARAFDRRIDPRVQRQALTVALLGVAAVVASSLAVMMMTPFTLTEVLFETTSAFGTVGLSTGITADLPGAAQILITGLMFLGRLGPITLVSAMALRERPTLYELPEGRPIIG